MGQLLIVEGEDFSNNPNAINVNSLPVVTDQLYAFFANSNATVDSDGVSILRLPSNLFGNSVLVPADADFRPTLIQDGAYFNGPAVSHTTEGASEARGLVSEGNMAFSFTDGVSFTFLYRRAYESVIGASRCLFALRESEIQVLACAHNNTPQHLSIGSGAGIVRYDLGLGDTPAAIEALTFVFLKTSVKTYKNGTLVSTVTISELPDNYDGRFYTGANWNGSSSAGNCQIRQIYIHKKELNLSEVQDIHNMLPNLLA